VLLIGTDQLMIGLLLKWLAFLYFTLSLFHVIPGFPLEVGRILHVILWKALNDTWQAIRIAGRISWVIGLLIAVGGIMILIFTVEKFTGVFLIGIGLVLQNAATHSLKQSKQTIIQNLEA
jgi:Zn-dependent protease